MARRNGKCGTDARHHVVLVADDDPLIVATLGQRLRGEGYNVLEAFDGPAALAVATDARPDLAIIDHAMPGMSGVEVSRELAASSAVPVIFLSAYSDDTIVDEAIAAGAMTYIVKPIDVQQLLPIVRAALERSREAHALQGQNERLRATLEKDQNVSAATGVLMAALRVGQREAFERLRHHARSRRAKLEDVASELLRSFEVTAKLLQEYAVTTGPESQAKPDEGPGRTRDSNSTPAP